MVFFILVLPCVDSVDSKLRRMAIFIYCIFVVYRHLGTKKSGMSNCSHWIISNYIPKMLIDISPEKEAFFKQNESSESVPSIVRG